MGFAEGAEGTSGSRREEAGTKAQRQKGGLDCCGTEEVAWLVFPCEGRVGRGTR